jgi:hypothetical protein
MHQALLLWAIRKMTADGFAVIAKDGIVPDGGLWNGLAPPPTLKDFRPDACGLDLSTGRLAFGEAKTEADITTSHTRRQLQVFANTIHRSDATRCRLYLAVPRSASTTLDWVLGKLGLLGMPHVVRLHIPDCLIAHEKR